MENVLRRIFMTGVESVKPKNLISSSRCTQIVEETLSQASAPGDNKRHCHLVGFGKAVLNMAVPLDRLVRFESGILSVPVGSVQQFRSDSDTTLAPCSKLIVYEGGHNNLPDEAAEKTARKVMQLAQSMTPQDILFVLISGGGSALLPLPILPISLAEKQSLIKGLADRGATITEINTVRIAISETKGGKLAKAARNAHKIVSLILSDIVDDPIQLIASGPTVVDRTAGGESPQSILERYGMWHSSPASIREVIVQRCPVIEPSEIGNSTYHIIGSVSVAIAAAAAEAARLGFPVCTISTRVQGNICDISKTYIELAAVVKQYLSGELCERKLIERLRAIVDVLNASEQFIEDLVHTLNAADRVRGVCLVAGGEPTVSVTGRGLGGRNQELALRFAVGAPTNVWLLAAGTDGIDGPTGAAGAIGTRTIVTGKRQHDVQDYLRDNNSYAYFAELASANHIVVGHTGTNVMDLHIIMILK